MRTVNATWMRDALTDLRTFLRFPTVSADPGQATAMVDCSRWLRDRLRHGGLRQVDVKSYGGPPLIVARSPKRTDRPTVLFYGHYDVVPAAHDRSWRTPPFEPSIRDGYIWARGATDNKGPTWAHVLAAEQLFSGSEPSPVNLIMILDGEEEVGSPHLLTALDTLGDLADVDCVVISDTRMAGPGRPALTYSLRGSVALEIRLSGADRELHSGAFGGAVVNPLHRLGDVVSSFHDGCGHVAIPGFYHSVRPIEPGELRQLRHDGPSAQSFRRSAGSATLRQDRGLTPFETSVLRPALNVTGIEGGYTGPGQKSAIATGGVVRLNVRLVPDQDPDDIVRLITAHVQRALIPGLRADVSINARSAPVVTERRHAAVDAASRAYEGVYGRRPVMLPSGGSIPAVAMLHHRFRRPMVLMGFSQPDDGMHGANERFRVDGLWEAMCTCIAFYHGIAS
jgi:acetylornithine deacetylase/succinyl-diaminopimelate desuccinylase-like protein